MGSKLPYILILTCHKLHGVSAWVAGMALLFGDVICLLEQYGVFFPPQLLFETLSEQGKICSVNLVFILTLVCYISAFARILAERCFMLMQNTSLL